MTVSKKHILATTVGFVATFIANSILAMTIIGPFLNEKIGIVRNPAKEGLNFPAILIGYLLLTIYIVWLTPLVNGATWIKKGLIAGAMTGFSVNVAGHLIIAGWSIAGGSAMFFADIIDSLATIMGGVIIAYLLRNNDAK